MEFFRKTLDPVIALAAIAVLDIFLFPVVGAWTVGGGETMMTGLDTERPAYNLFEQAQRLPLPEFAARMLVGIRGDRVTATDNPFSDAELQALITLYRGRQGR